MPGNKSGSASAKQQLKTIRDKYGENYFKLIGAEGGRNGHTGGFYHSKINGLNTHIEAGRKGGKRSRRGPKLPAPKPNLLNRIRRLIYGNS